MSGSNGKTVLAGGNAARFERRDVLFLVAVISLAAVIRLVFYRGVFSPDEFNYLRHAGEWWNDCFDAADLLYLHGTRPLIFVPVAWLFSVVGVRELAAIAWPFVASLGVVGFVYEIGRRWLGREYGVIAAMCAVVLPLLVEESTRLLPGAVMNMLMAASVLCFVVSEQDTRHRFFWLGMSGAVFGAMQLAGELGLVLGCFFPFAILMCRRYPILSYWPAAAGFAAMVVASLLYYLAHTGDLFFKNEISRMILVMQTAPVNPLYYVKVIVRPLAGHGGVFYLSSLGVIAAVLGRKRIPLVIAAWFVCTFAFIEFGSSSMTEYRPLFKSVRYLSVISVPGVLAAAVGVVWIRRELARRLGGSGGRWSSAWVAGVFIVVGLLSVATLLPNSPRIAEKRDKLELIGEQVRAYKGKPVYVTHWLWNTYIGYVMEFDDDYFPSGYHPYHAVHIETADSTSMNRYVQTLSDGEPIGPGLLINDEKLLEASEASGASEANGAGEGRTKTGSVGSGDIPDVLRDIPDTWLPLFRISVGTTYLPVLYDLPENAHWPPKKDT